VAHVQFWITCLTQCFEKDKSIRGRG
jgi:hypothetical protein